MAIGQFMPMFLAAIDEPDPYWSNVVAMLHFDGDAGSTLFPDTSTNNLSLSRAGNAQISTDQSRFGNASLLLDGTGDYLFANSPALPAMGSRALTIEFFAYQSVQKSSDIGLIDFRQAASDGEPVILLVNGVLHFYASGWNSRFNLGSFGVGVWRHIALTRDADGYWHFFVDGVRATGTYRQVTAFTRRGITIGTFVDQRTTSAANKFNGYIDELRLTYGVARYTADFTPPTQPFPDF